MAALKEFAEWVDEDNAPVEELVDKEDIREAFKKHRNNFSVPILTWDILHMAWANKTGFLYDEAFISPRAVDNIFESGFSVFESGFNVTESDGTLINIYQFGDFFDKENVRMDWVALNNNITNDLENRHKAIAYLPDPEIALDKKRQVKQVKQVKKENV